MRRRKKTCKVAPPPKTRAELGKEHGQVWTTAELAHEFIVTAIIGTEVVVRRKADNVVGTLTYQNDPRYYFAFKEAPAMKAETSK